ncbi:hypothetical protein JCM10450v2_007213 [Rhodotorula kratochvilovae]
MAPRSPSSWPSLPHPSVPALQLVVVHIVITSGYQAQERALERLDDAFAASPTLHDYKIERYLLCISPASSVAQAAAEDTHNKTTCASREYKTAWLHLSHEALARRVGVEPLRYSAPIPEMTIPPSVVAAPSDGVRP